MPSNKMLSAALGAALLMSAPSWATPPASNAPLPWAAPITKATQGQAVIVQSFPGPEGLTALVIGPAPGVQDQGKIIGWGLPNGLVVVGNLFDRNGRNLNDAILKTMGDGRTAPPESKSASHDIPTDKLESLLGSLDQAVAMGAATLQGEASANQTLYIFFDPLCGHCKRLYKELQTPGGLPAGVKVAWLPVSILGGQGIPLAAYALSGPDALHKVMTLSKEGLKNIPAPDEKTRSLLAINNVVLDMTGKAITPFMVWRDASGQPRYEPGFSGSSQLQAIWNSLRANP